MERTRKRSEGLSPALERKMLRRILMRIPALLNEDEMPEREDPQPLDEAIPSSHSLYWDPDLEDFPFRRMSMIREWDVYVLGNRNKPLMGGIPWQVDCSLSIHADPSPLFRDHSKGGHYVLVEEWNPSTKRTMLRAACPSTLVDIEKEADGLLLKAGEESLLIHERSRKKKKTLVFLPGKPKRPEWEETPRSDPKYMPRQMVHLPHPNGGKRKWPLGLRLPRWFDPEGDSSWISPSLVRRSS